VILGIDLTATEQRPSACAALDVAARVLDLRLCQTDNDLLALAEEYRPEVVAIDAPLSLPAGLDCLEETCPCRQTLPHKGRACEQALARLGIGCYFTTKRSLIKTMVYRGIALQVELVRRGLTVIEVYPFATRRRLFGRLPGKATRAGREALWARLRPLLASGPALPEALPSHDVLDALLAAYTGLLYAHHQAEALGDPTEGLLWLPKAATSGLFAASVVK
jgi:predicted nuclease with RNAse H fold